MISKPALAVALCACVAQSVQAAEPACITPIEARAAIVKLAPAALEGVRSKCAAVLPKAAYLNVQGNQLASRLKLPVADPAALQSLVGKLQPGGIGSSSALNTALVEIAVAAITSGIEKDLKVDTCPTIDKSLALLDPLPTENLIGIVQLVATAASRDDAKKRKAAGKSVGVQLCETP